MQYLIDPEEIMMDKTCPVYTPCPTFCHIKPMYGVPIILI